MSLTGRTALVTGASRGLGLALALALRKAGAEVVVAGRTESAARRAAQLADGRWVVCDVADQASVVAASQRITHVDVLVNNAGVAPTGKLHQLAVADWQQAFAVNATGAFLCTRAWLPQMLAQGWGRVVNVASTAGLEGGAYLSAYAASKHAMVGMTTSLAAEVQGTGVTANALCPAYIDTDMAKRAIERARSRGRLSPQQAERAVLDSAGQARLLSAEEVAGRAVALCEGQDNGQVVVMDGNDTCA